MKSRAAMPGALYVVATPIGNLDDMSRRGMKVLSSVEMIAAEDTRRTQVLLAEIGAHQAELVALHSHNETAATRRLLGALRSGRDAALVSDAGTPLVSDPGFELVRDCWSEGIPVVPIPGPSALLAALAVSPLPAARFLFEGFLPAKPGQRRARLAELTRMPFAVAFFEAPHRILACLADLAALVPSRRILIGREMTKHHESFYCDIPERVAARLGESGGPRGEFVGVLEAAASAGLDADADRVLDILCRELKPAQAARIAAQLLDRDKADLYPAAVARSK